MRPDLAAVLAAWAITLVVQPAFGQTVETPPVGPVVVDHHVHVHSPAILGFLPDYCASPGRVGSCPEVFTLPLTVEQLLSEMDAAGVQRALLMSTAYLAESPMMVPARRDSAELIRQANAFTVELTRQRPERLGAFIGVNPLTPTAMAEIRHWAGDPAVSGVKLHLTNSDADLREPADVAALAAVFEAAGQGGLDIMIHMRTRAEDYGLQDVQVFLADILPKAQGRRVMIAHSGGWGGLDEVTWGALDAFAEALEADPDSGGNLRFDLAQVFKADTPDADLERLVGVMRRIGVEKFVPGSDWPFSGPLDAYLDTALSRLPLTPDEARRLRRAR
jgi:predicted TIM-barrel fold metal-dependent hydrolase